MPATGATNQPAARTPSSLVAYALVALLLLAVAISLPIALVSMVQDVSHEAGHTYFLVKPAAGAVPTMLLHAQLINLSELEGTVQLRVSGAQLCLPALRCPATTRV